MPSMIRKVRGRKFISDCCNRSSSKHAMVSYAINFVNCLQTVSVAILMEDVLILFCGWGGGIVCFVSFQVPLTSCASPWRAGETKNDVPSKLNRLLICDNVHFCLVLFVYCSAWLFFVSFVHTFVILGFLHTCYFVYVRL
jgi:hypothetical protein